MMTTTRTRPGEGPRVLLLRATARAAGFVTGQVSEPGPGPLRPPNPRGQRRESSAGAVGQVRASSHPWPGPADAVMTHDLPPWGALPPGIWGRRSYPATSELHRVTGRDCPARPAPGGPEARCFQRGVVTTPAPPPCHVLVRTATPRSVQVQENRHPSPTHADAVARPTGTLRLRVLACPPGSAGRLLIGFGHVQPQAVPGRKQTLTEACSAGEAVRVSLSGGGSDTPGP